MHKKYILFMLALCLGGVVSAQTLEQAKLLFSKGKYAEAKPAFRRLVRQNPNNASYNFWYGACCFETGETQSAEGFLQKAADRKVMNAYRYLALLQAGDYRYEEAMENQQAYMALLEKKKDADTQEAEQQLEEYKRGNRMLKGTERVAVIDSFVVSKAAFLSAYHLGQESGSLEETDRFWGKDPTSESVLYQNELKNKIFYARRRGDVWALYAQDKLADKWGEAYPLQGLGGDGNQNYPYLLSDGVTLYYASDGEGTLGGYDIFVTRYNSETNSYLRPENIGMPFNSPANDYLYAIDEYNNLGWFASDRYQPEGKVCVYVFIPNESRVTYNYEDADEAVVRQAAQMRCIASTWTDKASVRAAQTRLSQMTSRTPGVQRRRDFAFVIDDQSTYVTLSNFKSPRARQLFLQWQQRKKVFDSQCAALESKRLAYHQGDANQRKRLTAEILALERQTEQERGELARMEVEVRNAEKKHLTK